MKLYCCCQIRWMSGATKSKTLQEHRMRSENRFGLISTVTSLHAAVHPLDIFGPSIIPSFNLCPPHHLCLLAVSFLPLISAYNGRLRVAAPSGHLTDHLTPVQPTTKRFKRKARQSKHCKFFICRRLIKSIVLIISRLLMMSIRQSQTIHCGMIYY